MVDLLKFDEEAHYLKEYLKLRKELKNSRQEPKQEVEKRNKIIAKRIKIKH